MISWNCYSLLFWRYVFVWETNWIISCENSRTILISREIKASILFIQQSLCVFCFVCYVLKFRNWSSDKKNAFFMNIFGVYFGIVFSHKNFLMTPNLFTFWNELSFQYDFFIKISVRRLKGIACIFCFPHFTNFS